MWFPAILRPFLDPGVLATEIALSVCFESWLPWMIDPCVSYMMIPIPKLVTLLYSTDALGTPNSIPSPTGLPESVLLRMIAPAPIMIDIANAVFGFALELQ